MSNLFSKELRIYIPPTRYEAYVQEQYRKTFIGKNLEHYDFKNHNYTNYARYKELSTLEEKGFTFYAEKQWLVDYSIKNGESLYSDWLLSQFNKNNIHFIRGGEYDAPLKAKLPLKLLPHFKQLDNPIYKENDKYSTIELGVLDDGFGKPNPAHLIQLYEFIFDLEYMLYKMPQPQNFIEDPLKIIGLDVTNKESPAQWNLEVLSWELADFEQYFVNREPWGNHSSKQAE